MCLISNVQVQREVICDNNIFFLYVKRPITDKKWINGGVCFQNKKRTDFAILIKGTSKASSTV